MLRKAEVKLSQGETVDHSPLSIDQLRLGQPQQIAGMVGATEQSKLFCYFKNGCLRSRMRSFLNCRQLSNKWAILTRFAQAMCELF